MINKIKSSLQQVMNKFDVNHDGELQKKEVRAMVDELKVNLVFLTHHL